MNDGFNIIWAKSGGRPYNAFFFTRREVVEFLLKNLNNMDLISINDVNINKEQLLKDNLKLTRYLKLQKIYEI
jgi:hypothetical protein